MSVESDDTLELCSVMIVILSLFSLIETVALFLRKKLVNSGHCHSTVNVI